MKLTVLCLGFLLPVMALAADKPIVLNDCHGQQFIPNHPPAASLEQATCQKDGIWQTKVDVGNGEQKMFKDLSAWEEMYVSAQALRKNDKTLYFLLGFKSVLSKPMQ